MPDIKPVSNELVNVNWPLEEQASDQFNIAGGWGSGTFVGSVGITLNNLSIKNFFKKGAWRPYPMGQNQRLSLSAQTNGTYYKAFALSFTDPWLGGKKPNSFTISAHFSEQNNAYYVWQKSDAVLPHVRSWRQVWASVSTGPTPTSRFYGEASYERFIAEKLERDSAWTNGAAEPAVAQTRCCARNSVDQPIYPRRGSEFSASVQAHAPLLALGRQGLQEAGGACQQHGQQGGGQSKSGALPLGRVPQVAVQGAVVPGADLRNSNLVLMLKAEMGYLGKLQQDTRFRLSSASRSAATACRDTTSTVSTSSPMRGYEDGALDPVERLLRRHTTNTPPSCATPIILKPSSQIYVLGFLEGGNAFDSWKKFSPFRIKRSAGFGVRLYLPVVGMLGIDWGYGFDPPGELHERQERQPVPLRPRSAVLKKALWQ